MAEIRIEKDSEYSDDSEVNVDNAYLKNPLDMDSKMQSKTYYSSF